MHLTRETLDAWAATLQIAASDRRRILRLEEGDSMDGGNPNAPGTCTIPGPAIVELIVYRDGGWSARELPCETPESIATIEQRQRAEENRWSDGWSSR